MDRLSSEPGYLLVTVTIALGAMWFVKRLMARPRNLPPGPTGLPLIGAAWPLIRAKPDPLHLLASWADTYGDIMSFSAGPITIVVLNTYETVVEACQHPDLNNRPKSLLMEETLGIGNDGVILANGKIWKEQRNFIHSVFRNLGVGKKRYEDTVAAEMAQLIAAIEEKKGAAFNPSTLLEQAFANVICSIVFGTQYTYTDTDFKRILHLIHSNMENTGGGGMIMFLPLPGISRVPGIPRRIASNMRETVAFLLEQIASHERELDPENPRDFIDLYLNKIKETEEADTSFNKHNMNACMADLFIAGTETTTTTTKWGILYMMAYPEVQSRVQAELDRVVGRERLPCLDDRKDLPYTMAVLMEVQRRGAVAPLSVPHIAAADTTLRGYNIPQGAVLISNLWKILNDQKLWHEPETFRPERFLTEEGRLIKREELIFFSAGRRVCLGEQLARMETFLGFTSLLHRFTFKKPDGSAPLSFQGVLGATRNTTPYETRAIPRD